MLIEAREIIEAHFVKLSASEVKAIRESQEMRKTLAERYGVTPRTISHIRSRETWGYVE